MEHRLPFHVQLKKERERLGLSQAELAKKIGIDAKTMNRWETGKSFPQPLHLRRFSEVVGKTVEELGFVNEPQGAPVPRPRADWGEAPRGGIFYGRDQELRQLEQWIVAQQCRVVTVLGIGGIGKTTLTANVVENVKEDFDYIFWRSLHNAPFLSVILKQCIQFVSDQQRIDIPERIDDQISVLIPYLQQYRCLFVLDNVESILRSGPRPGHYLEGYENYAELVQRLGETSHRSCLLLTSREKPGEVTRLEGRTSPVHSLPLVGVQQSTGQEILQDRGLTGSEEQWLRLVNLYSGNPLALKLVSESIHSVFGGDIDKFLQAEEIAFGDINELLEQQFRRLSFQERELLYWLAIEREPVSLQEIQDDLVHTELKHGSLLEALDGLRRRFMIESRGGTYFTLQPVILEYITNLLVKQACDEVLEDGNVGPVVWLNYALIKAQAKEYIRESQVRLILAPIARHLQAEIGEEDIERRLKSWLDVRRQASVHQRNYIAGNVLNFLIFLQRDLRNADFSHLMIRQAYLQDIALPNVNFAAAHFSATVFTNIFGNVFSISCSQMNNFMAVGTATGEIWIYEMLTGTPVLSLSGHTDSVWAVSFSPDERLLVSSSDDRTIRLWDLTTGDCLGIVVEYSHRVRAVAFSPDGHTLASGCDDNIVRLWDIQEGRYRAELQGHTERVWSVAFSPDGSVLASGSNDNTIRLWNTTTGECLGMLEGHTSWVRSVTFSFDGHLLASGSDDQTVRVWDLSTNSSLRVLSGHTDHVLSVDFSPDGHLLASGGEDRTVRLWDVETGHCLRILQGHMQGLRAVAFQYEGKFLVSGGDDQTIRLWDVATGYCLKTLQGYTRRVWSVAFSPDGRALVSSSEDRRIRLWKLETGQNYKALLDRVHGVRAVVFSPDGSLLASGGEDKTVRIWSVATNRCLHILKGHKKWVRAVAYSPDGQWLASGGEDSETMLWNVATGQGRPIPQGHSSWVRSVIFSPDGSLLASGSDDQTIRVWDLRGDRSLHILSGHTGRVRSIDFSPDGGMIASGSEDRTIRLWDVSMGSVKGILMGHTSWVRCVVFSPVDNLLASSSDDHTIRLWKVDDGRCVAILSGHRDRIRSLAFSPDGQYLVSGSDDGEMKLWNPHAAMYLKNLIHEKPYEGMNITGIDGITEAQRESLLLLGALDDGI